MRDGNIPSTGKNVLAYASVYPPLDNIPPSCYLVVAVLCILTFGLCADLTTQLTLWDQTTTLCRMEFSKFPIESVRVAGTVMATRLLSRRTCMAQPARSCCFAACHTASRAREQLTTPLMSSNVLMGNTCEIQRVLHHRMITIPLLDSTRVSSCCG
jgi:hypothetical protein